MPLAGVFAEGALGNLLYALGVIVVAGGVGIRLRSWNALGVVFAMWLALMVLAAFAGWLDRADELTPAGKVFLSVVLTLLPALTVSAIGVLLGRRIRRLPPTPGRERGARSPRSTS